MSKKLVYPRICANHPKRTKNLRYVYLGQGLWGGQLLCKECRDGKSETEVDNGAGEVSDMQQS